MTPLFRLLAPVLLFGAVQALSPPLHAGAQDVGRTRVEENFRRQPNGLVLGRLTAGVPLTVVARKGRWLQVDLEGWMWTRSLQATDRSGFDVVVTAAGGENLRARPSGSLVGRLERGTLLKEVERVPGWVHVRRRGWLWAPSVETSRGVEGAPAADSGVAPGAGGGSAFAPRPEIVAAGAEGSVVLTAPDGDTLARTVPGADLQVVSRRGNWARVRIEGWTWLLPSAPSEQDVTARELTPAKLAGEPDAWLGRVVTWPLQFISLEHAERVRTDFLEGEPFLLTRYGGAGGPFVYVAVPPDRVAAARALVPLERVVVTGRVRTGASALTGTPILDLISLERSGDAG